MRRVWVRLLICAVVVGLIASACEQTAPPTSPTAGGSSPTAADSTPTASAPISEPTRAGGSVSTPTALPTATATKVPDVVQRQGALPPIAQVTYRTAEGEEVTVPAFSGWVSLVAGTSATAAAVARSVEAAGATILEANANAGLYTLSTTPGNEGGLIAKLRDEAWVVAVTPTVSLAPQQTEKPVKVLDLPYDPQRATEGSKCLDYHGDLTGLQVAEAGLRAEVLDITKGLTAADVAAILNSEYKGHAHQPWMTKVGNMLDEAMRTGSVVNMSIGAPNKKGQIHLSTAAYRDLQVAFLAMVYRTAEAGPDVPVIVSAGNGDAKKQGVDLTKYVTALRQQFPKARDRVRLVQATDQSGKPTAWSNTSSVGSIAAPGEDITIDTTGLLGAPIKCSGTSFGAPVIAAVAGEARNAAPQKSSAEIWAAVEKVTQGSLRPGADRALVARRVRDELGGRGVAALEVNPQALTIEVGKNQALLPKAKDSAGNWLNDIPGKAFTFISSNPNVAAVDAAGFVDGKAPGTAVITVSIDGYSVKISVTVNPRPTPTPTPIPAPKYNYYSGSLTLNVQYRRQNSSINESHTLSVNAQFSNVHLQVSGPSAYKPQDQTTQGTWQYSCSYATFYTGGGNSNKSGQGTMAGPVISLNSLKGENLDLSLHVRYNLRGSVPQCDYLEAGHLAQSATADLVGSPASRSGLWTNRTTFTPAAGGMLYTNPISVKGGTLNFSGSINDVEWSYTYSGTLTLNLDRTA